MHRGCTDLQGVDHIVEVTADSLYEAVADVGHGQTQISVIVRHPEVEHRVRVQDFVRWLESQGRTPKEVSLKSQLRDLLNSGARFGISPDRERADGARGS